MQPLKIRPATVKCDRVQGQGLSQQISMGGLYFWLHLNQVAFNID